MSMANVLKLDGSSVSQTERPFIEFAGVGKVFQSKDAARIEAIRDVSFTVGKNQFVTIVGPSGCGKSTLLKMLAGLLTPNSGRIILDSEESPRVGHGLSPPAL